MFVLPVQKKAYASLMHYNMSTNHVILLSIAYCRMVAVSLFYSQGNIVNRGSVG